MKRKYILIFVLIILSSLLCGCWDSISIEKKNIVTLVIVDHKDNKYGFYIEVVNILGGLGNKESNKVAASFLHAEGKSYTDARDALERECDNKIFLGATRAVIFTKEITTIGIEEYMNRLKGNHDYRKSIDVITTSTEPEKITVDKPENDSFIGTALENTLKDLVSAGISIHVSAGDVLQAMADKKCGFILPEVNIVNDESTLTGFSVFKKAKAIGIIPAEERNGLILLLAKEPSLTYTVLYNGSKIIIKTNFKNREIEPLLKINKLNFNISINMEAKITYMDKFILLKDEDLLKVSELLSKQIKKDIENTINISQKKYQCDYLQFYKYFRARYQSKFKTVNWEEMYGGALMNINADIYLKGAETLDVRAE